MKEIIQLINISYPYGDKFVDLIIKFIKRFEEITINKSLKEISEIIENMKFQTEKYYNNKLPIFLNSLKDEYKNIDLIKEMKNTFEKIIKGSFQGEKKKNNF